LKPALTTKEEVLSRSKPKKKVLGVPIPGTTGTVQTAEETEKAPRPSRHRARAADISPEALESNAGGGKAPKEDTSTPMAPIKQ